MGAAHRAGFSDADQNGRVPYIKAVKHAASENAAGRPEAEWGGKEWDGKERGGFKEL